MPISKEDLTTALRSIDPKNNDLWTDDGSPRVSAVRSASGDETITRSLVNELVPGFLRPGYEPKPPAVSEGAIKTVDVTGAAPLDLDKSADAYVPLRGDDGVDPLLESIEVDATGDKLSDEAVREILDRRVLKCVEDISAAQEQIKEGNMNLRKSQERHAKALRDVNRRFPPLSFEENIKQHLATQARLREEAAGIFNNGGKSNLDIATSQRVIAARRGRSVPQFSQPQPRIVA